MDGKNDIRLAPTVLRWLDRTAHDGETAASRDHRIDVLARFTGFVGKEPDEIVEFCFLRKRDTGDRFVSTKRRAIVNEQIQAFVEEQGWTLKAAVVNGNIVRGFLIHNAVPIGTKVWTGG
jgi:hypothetical protein